MKKKRQIHEVGAENDIRYRGPLSYQHFRILAWLLLVLAQVGVVVSFAGRLIPDYHIVGDTTKYLLSLCSEVATPLLLIANFAVILAARTGYRALIFRFGILSALAIGLFMLLYERYAVGIVSAIRPGADAHAVVNSVISGRGFFAFNIFLDLFLCTLVMFFLNYKPTKTFRGKSLVIFRLLAIIPIAYEAASVVLKILASMGKITLSPYFYPFLTTKPPVEFVMFVSLALFFKRRERKFTKRGKTHDDYKEFLGTKLNSLHFSIRAAVTMVIAAAVDFLILIVLSTVIVYPYIDAPEFNDAVIQALLLVTRWGFGLSIPLIVIAPLMLLFSYNRKPKFPQIDMIIPIVGVVLIVLVYVESLYQAVGMIAGGLPI